MKFSKILLVSALFLFLGNMASAQPAGGGPGGPPVGGTPPCWPPPCVPFDGGISFLIVAGVALGGKKLYDHRKDINSNTNETES